MKRILRMVKVHEKQQKFKLLPRAIVAEGFENHKFQAGTINFSTSTETDPHIVKIVDAIAKAKGVAPQQVIDYINAEKQELESMHQIAPLLYGTMVKNVVESTLFKLFWKTDVVTNAPEFSGTVFYKLIRSIRADNDEFFPLRGFIDKRRLEPKITYVNLAPDAKGVTTAAASPTGEFIFNVPFMQKLMDFSHLKGVKPRGKKYISNGGDIPDEYCYIEFLIMHEFMHYSNDDFYYQKIIPNAKNEIINWVGDFRTNYLLVKSGYEQLPMGLFNDDINYDRQKTYIDMYNAVLEEFKKLNKDQQDKIRGQMDGQSDDHKPGQEQGKESDVDTQGKGPGDIDGNAKRIEKQMEDAKDADAKDRAQANNKGDGEGQGGNALGPGTGNGTPSKVDYSHIMPTFNWQTLVRKFLMSAKPRTEETYTKPHRRNVSNLDIARQTGAAAIRPAEKPMEYSDVQLAFCFDSSGSMSSVIGMVYANAMKLLRQPAFRKTQALVAKFSGSHELFKCNFATGKAAQVTSVDEKPQSHPLSTQQIFSTHMSGGTVFSPALANDLIQSLHRKYNVIIFSDSDILDSSNLTHFMSVIKASPQQTFVIFDSRDTYIQFRQTTGISTPNITYFQ